MLHDHKPCSTSTPIHMEPCMNCAVTEAKQHNAQQLQCCTALQLACIAARRYSVMGSNCSAVVCIRISCSLLLTTAKMSLCKTRSQIYRINPEPSGDLWSASNSCITSSVCMCHPDSIGAEGGRGYLMFGQLSCADALGFTLSCSGGVPES